MVHYFVPSPLLPFIPQFNICDGVTLHLVGPHMASPHLQPRIDDGEPNDFRWKGSNKEDDCQKNGPASAQNHELCPSCASAPPGPSGEEYPTGNETEERQRDEAVCWAAVETELPLDDGCHLKSPPVSESAMK